MNYHVPPFVCLYVRFVSSSQLFFYLLHWHTIFGTWVYCHETVCHVHSWFDVTLTIDLKLKLKGYLTCLHVQPVIIFASTLAYHILHMDVSPWDNVSRTFMTPIRHWPLVSKLYFHHEFEAGQDRLCSLAQAYQVCNMGVSPSDNM